MFNITHTAKPGVCKRRRCSRPSVENGLCEKDFAEWRAAGSPVFAANGAVITGGSRMQAAGSENALAEQRVEAERYLDQIREFQIVDQTGMDQAGALLTAACERRAEIKARMDQALAPLLQSLDQQRAIYKPVDKLYAEIEAILRDRINNHIRVQQEAQDRARVAVEQAGGSVDEHTLVVAHGIENVALPVGMGLQESWVAEVTDELALRRGVALTELVRSLEACVEAGTFNVADGAALVSQVATCLGVGLVPADLLCVDHKALAKLGRETKNTAEFSGVTITLKTTARRAAARRA